MVDTEIININDTDYLINTSDKVTIYDINTHKEIGKYDEKNNKIKKKRSKK